MKPLTSVQIIIISTGYSVYKINTVGLSYEKLRQLFILKQQKNLVQTKT